MTKLPFPKRGKTKIKFLRKFEPRQMDYQNKDNEKSF